VWDRTGPGSVSDSSVGGGGVPRAWVGIGSNIGDRAGYMERALAGMNALPGTEVTVVSSIYDTAPVGAAGQPRYLNAVAQLETDMPPLELLRSLLSIEADCGRVRSERWGPRTLDLDLILFEGVETESDELTLPHPRARGRAFVLVPLAEVAPDLRFPGDSVTVARIVEGLGDLGPRLERIAGPPTVPAD
jgi:2-amino-4-hydroxy-6-hydroxymethyldihydropteridine diphosphokinase